MSRIDVYAVVQKLLGPIEPVGESHTDSQRAVNQKEYQMLIEQLVQDIRELHRCRNNHQWSMKNAWTEAEKFLVELRNSLNDVLE